jgi:hypothetical protein
MRSAVLFDSAVIQDSKAGTHHERLALIVSYIHDGYIQLTVEPDEFQLHILTNPSIERSERFIE